MTDAPAITLYDWTPSPFCMKVRALLRHKGVAYRRLSALEHFRALRRKSGIGKVPVLELDGEVLGDSTDISHALERRCPDPAVLPANLRDRALCHVLEDWADDALYFFGLYFHWHEPSGREHVAAYFRRTLVGRIAYRPYLVRIERQLRGHGTSRKTPAHVRADLDRNLDAIEALLTGGDYLLGTGPYLCDFAVMSQMLYLQLAPTMNAVFEHRPGIRAFLDRMPSPFRD